MIVDTSAAAVMDRSRDAIASRIPGFREREPWLFKGDDFGHTDVVPVMDKKR